MNNFMPSLKLVLATLSLIAGAVVSGNEFSRDHRALLITVEEVERSTGIGTNELALRTNLPVDSQLTERYVLDSSRSSFIARAKAGGLLWFKGKDHLIAVREFTGEARLTPNSIIPASLEIIAKAASMVETRDVFTEQEKQIINKELREIVLEPDKYPDIIFKSTSVTGKPMGSNQYELTITGNLTLHGATRPITIPTQVTIAGNRLRARGGFSIDRDDFNVKATSAVHGLVRVRKKVEFTFDIVGHRR
jgi:polyisoprenoid-binding protein YceI